MRSIKNIVDSNSFETVAVLKYLNTAHRYLGELKGLCKTIPNQAIIINTLRLQEAQDSSAIENIITTQDEVYKSELSPYSQNIAAKEVQNYAQALNFLYRSYRQSRLLTNNMIIEAQQIIKANTAGVRRQKGIALVDRQTKKTLYIPPEPSQLQPLLNELEQFINDTQTRLDPIIKMAIIHHQFESIHPFYDGNGRIGRIINIIYLIQQGLLDTPILYLSRYINHNRSRYYQLLQSVRDDNTWQQWILFMVEGVAKTAQSTIRLINDIKELQQQYKITIRNNHPKIYSQQLLNNIFKHPYTKIAFVQEDLKVSRLTASRYLDRLVNADLLTKRKLGRENYYLNTALFELLSSTENLENI